LERLDPLLLHLDDALETEPPVFAGEVIAVREATTAA
jgi:hypothetical protein